MTYLEVSPLYLDLFPLLWFTIVSVKSWPILECDRTATDDHRRLSAPRRCSVIPHPTEAGNVVSVS